MKKKTIIKILKTINKCCYSSKACSLCVLEHTCPYSTAHMFDSEKVRFVAQHVKNIIDKEKQSNESN